MSIIKHDFEKMNITKIKQTKNRQKLTVITAYDALFSILFSKSSDMILVGDSLNMSFMGKSDTLSAKRIQHASHGNTSIFFRPLFIPTDSSTGNACF